LILRAATLSILTAAASACASAAPPPASAGTAPGAPAPAPSTALDALEQRLATARSFRFHARLATSGRIESHFDGTVVAGEGARMRVAFQGAFGGRDADALFTCDGAHMRGGPRGHAFDMAAAPSLRESMAVELVRRGVTHTAASLAMGEAPESLDGTAGRHLEVVGLEHAAGKPVRGAPTEQWTWLLYVDHKKAADETLWLDARTGLPLERRVVVHFPEGDMTAGEEYDDFVVDGPVEADTFRIEP